MNLNFKVDILIFLLFQFLGSNHEFEARSRENVIVVLGTKTDSRAFKDYKQFWDIDKNFESQTQGLKLHVNSLNNEVESISVVGEKPKSDKAGFQKFSSTLPFDLSWDDNAEVLQTKLGIGEKLLGKNALQFCRGNIGVEASLNNSGKIAAFRFYNKPNRLVLSQPATADIRKESSATVKMREELKTFEPKLITAVQPVHDTSVFASSPFKQAILEVFHSYNESHFNSIKGDPRTNRNFWNYQFTYATRIKIPGEKFNMLYSFPFLTSPLDFVSVIKESDEYDSSIESAHKAIEKKLLENFTAKEGWVASCIPNKESKKLSDLEFRNDKYGAVILDYSRNPRGKHVVYLRFLLFSS